MPPKKDKKKPKKQVLKKKPAKKTTDNIRDSNISKNTLSQRVAVNVNLGSKRRTKRTASKSSDAKSQGLANYPPIIINQPPVYIPTQQMPTADNIKINDLWSQFVRPKPETNTEKVEKNEIPVPVPVRNLNLPKRVVIDEPQKDLSEYEDFGIPPYQNAKAEYLSEPDKMPKRRGRPPVAKTPEQLEQERIERNARNRNRYREKQQDKDLAKKNKDYFTDN